MLHVTINGLSYEMDDGLTILEAIRAIGEDVPTLCHDERLHPTGACRMCVVAVNGWNRHATACNTLLVDGMQIETHSPDVEEVRTTLLKLLAKSYPPHAVEGFPEKEFHRWLKHYGIAPGANQNQVDQYRDGTHPYVNVDMSRCITCYRCVRICDEVQGQFAWRVWGRGAETHILPDSSTTLLESSCVSCGACVDTCPTGALEDQTVLSRGFPEEWTRTTCPYCGTGCEMMVGTRQGRIVQVKPVPDDPVSKGHLCIKGRYSFDFVHSKGRVTDPMLREGGSWRKSTWDEAIGFVAGRFKEIAEKHGPDSIGVLGSARGTNEENYLAQKFARLVLGTNNVDCCARVCHAPTAAGMKMTLGTGAATNSFDDIECAASFLICGCNPTENHPVVGARIKQAVLGGAKLVVIDPRQIELTRYADVHLAIRPGTNVPLLNAIAHVVLEEDLIDQETVRNRLADFERFREFIRAWPPERAAEICGVRAADIREAARLYAQCKPSMCFHGLGITEHVQGTSGVVCLVNLALLTGNIGREGSGVNPLRGQNNVQGAAHMGCEPGNLTGFVPIERGAEAFEAAWEAKVPRTHGLNLMEMMDAAAERKLSGLWAIGYDIALTNPNESRTREALGALELIVVQDLFVNELAREFGHVFLPACSSFERDGTFMNSERRVQRVRRAIEPIANSRPDWRIICDVAGAMGHQKQFDFHSPEDVWNEVRQVWKAGAGITYARMEKNGLQWPCPDEDHPGTKILHTDTFAIGRRAPLKCVEFIPSAEVVTKEYPFLLTTGRTLYQFNSGTMTMRTANTRLRDSDTLDMAPADAETLGFKAGDRVRLISRYGEATLPVRLDPRVKVGELFSTFHHTSVSLNQVTGPNRDDHVQTPEYKVVAVRLERVHSDVQSEERSI